MSICDAHYDIPLPRGIHDELNGAVWLDIETTGLSPVSSQVTLIGYLRVGIRSRRLTQVFVDVPNQEPEALSRLFTDLGDEALVITYNGRRFDIPFLRGRAAAWGIPVPRLRHHDLLEYVERLDPRRGRFGDHRLQTLMRALRLSRDDANDGREMVIAYRRWLERRMPEDRDEILLHNADDLVHLPELAAFVLNSLGEAIG